MNFFTAFIFGIVQGATEFLPVSSSGHIALFSRITGADASLSFSLILHLATVLAVCIAFREQVFSIIKKPLCSTTVYIILATVVSAVIALMLKPIAQSMSSGQSLAPFFMLSATILTISRLFAPKNAVKPLNAGRAITIGLCQGLAVFPGLSRSATTLSAGALLGVEKKTNTEFCFIMSVPLIIGSVIVDCFSSTAVFADFSVIAVGFVSALVSGLVSLKLIKRAFGENIKYFALYLIVLSIVITVNDCFLHLF
ncbi:MAG: undecaprenyl-diphosphate phosphatase [Clostridia bacterium]|nr:undecaprenyl-diphosphate phosphatase [Clostridia bacterium]